MDSPDELLVLLHGAFGRVSTLAGVMRHWKHFERGRRAFDAALIVRHFSMTRAPDGSSQERQELQRIWFSAPRRYREETFSVVGPHAELDQDRLKIDDGTVGWLIGPKEVTKVPPGALGHDLMRLLDPAWVLTHDLTVEDELENCGRPVLQVRADARAHVPRSGHAADMAATRQLLVDANLGFLHRSTALLDNEPYDVVEIQDLLLDHELDDGLFHPEIPSGTRIDDYSVRTSPSMPPQRRHRLKRLLRRR